MSKKKQALADAVDNVEDEPAKKRKKKRGKSTKER